MTLAREELKAAAAAQLFLLDEIFAEIEKYKKLNGAEKIVTAFEDYADGIRDLYFRISAQIREGA